MVSGSSSSSAEFRFDPEVLKALSGLQFRARFVVEGFLSGMHESPFHGYSAEFNDYRNYQPGDDLRHLDWRFFARADKLCIKRFEQETNLHFHVIVDTSASMAYQGGKAWGRKLDYAALLAASLTWLLLKQKDATSLLNLQATPVSRLAVGEQARARSEPQLRFLKASSKPSQFGQVVRQLEAAEAAGGPCLAQLLENARRVIPRRSVILLLSDLLDPADTVREQLKHLHFLGHEILVFQILDHDEIEFPFQKNHIFEDLESGARRRIQPERVRDDYLLRFGAFLKEYRDLFQNLGISHTLLPTEADPARALAFFLSQRKAFG
jgi:uncharacterized protein (DUF58 family)